MALTRVVPSVNLDSVSLAAQPIQPPLYSADTSKAKTSKAEVSKIETAQAMVESAQADQARMADVTLLLDSMFEREEATIGLVFNCLYDIGSVHWIDQRVANPPLNRLAQWTARLSKPAAKLVAIRWVKRNCSKLIANWLYTKVKFEPQQIAEVIEAAEAADIDQFIASFQAPLLAELDNCNRTISILQARVRLLAILLVSVTLTLGGGLAWSVWQSQPQPRSIESSAP